MSTLTKLTGEGAWVYDYVTGSNSAPSFSSGLALDASAEKCAFLGCIWHPTVKTGTINIRKVHFRCGALTFNILSTIRVSLQNVSATAGPPYQPDGTQDETYDFALGTGLTANAWNTTGNLSADRAVDLSAYSIGSTNSRWLAVVFEYSTFTAADSFIASGVTKNTTTINTIVGGNALLNVASWAAVGNVVPCVAFECDDGSYAFMNQALPFSAISSASVSSTGAIRAAGVKFKFPVELTTEAAAIMIEISGADGSIVLYDTDGTTALVTHTIDNDAVFSSSPRHAVIMYQPITHAADSYYRLVFVGGTSTAATLHYASVNAVGFMDGLTMGQNAHWTERDSGGTWTDTTTRRPFFGLMINSVHDGVGGAGGGMRLAGAGGLAA